MKFIFAITISVLILAISWGISSLIYRPVTEVAQRGYVVDTTPVETLINVTKTTADNQNTTTPVVKKDSLDIDALLASANIKKGARLAKKCLACHTLNAGGKNKIGPNLYDVEGRAVAATEGFKYSDAMLVKATEIKTWSLENLFMYLKKPSKFIPKNRMAFAGIKKPQDIANLLTYLRSLQ